MLVEARITGHNSGGLECEVSRLRGFIPISQISLYRVEDLALSRPNDPHYQLDAGAGEVRFGDDVHGRSPRPGQVVRAVSYRYGGGVRGNVPAEAI